MWIKSQDDEILINLDRVTALKHFKFFGSPDDHGPIHAVVALIAAGESQDMELGRYFTADRVAEVLEEIEDEIEKGISEVYYMPLE